MALIWSLTNWLPRAIAWLVTSFAVARKSTPGLMTRNAAVSQNAERNKNIMTVLPNGPIPFLALKLDAAR